MPKETYEEKKARVKLMGDRQWEIRKAVMEEHPTWGHSLVMKEMSKRWHEKYDGVKK